MNGQGAGPIGAKSEQLIQTEPRLTAELINANTYNAQIMKYYESVTYGCIVVFETFLALLLHQD